MSTEEKDNIKDKILTRYFIIVVALVFVAIFIFVKAGVVMYAENDYWTEVAQRYVKDSVSIKPIRGNIFSADDKLLASSIPEYDFRMDLNANEKQREDLKANINEISKGLNKIFPNRSANYFKNQILTGIRRKDRDRLIYDKRINYIELQKIKQLPVLSKHKYKSGLNPKEFNYRKKPFQSLASRTIGEMYGDLNKGAKNGLELYFDKELSGTSGSATRQKVRNQYIEIVKTPPVHGSDVITTLDVDMQDISEKALRDILKEYNASKGIVILMEVKTGDIKAIVNLKKERDGLYYESMNSAVADLYEQGSTVKTASILIALDDKKITLDSTQDLGNGMYDLYDRKIRDYNYRSGGFRDNKVKNITEIMMFSSNIGVGKTIEDAYKNNKQHFVDRFKEMLGMKLDIPIPGAAHPVIKDANDKFFSKTSLAWMSFGYETSIPAINVATFYNAIANNGKMMAPRFVSAISKEGSIVKEYPTQTLNSSIASSSAIKDMQYILEMVVSDGLGKRAKSEQFKVAGKTGTAQISQGKLGYKGSNQQHLLSFCGYFPADKPEYTCLVSITSANGGGGGMQSAMVFKEIAERVYAMKIRNNYNHQLEENNQDFLPDIKKGYYLATHHILKELGLEYKSVDIQDKTSAIVDNKIDENNTVLLTNVKTNPKLIPNVYGMGAKDAVFALESIGLNVQLVGKGKVFRQSIQGGQIAKRGNTIKIELR